jgi:hypothetical protein
MQYKIQATYRIAQLYGFYNLECSIIKNSPLKKDKNKKLAHIIKGIVKHTQTLEELALYEYLNRCK